MTMSNSDARKRHDANQRSRISGPDELAILVSPVTVLSAFRYGLNRATYAHADALALIRAHWPALARWRDSIEADLRRCREHPHPIAPDNATTAAECLAWIADQETH